MCLILSQILLRNQINLVSELEMVKVKGDRRIEEVEIGTRHIILINRNKKSGRTETVLIE